MTYDFTAMWSHLSVLTLVLSNGGLCIYTTINQANEARNDTIHSVPGQQVHQECRRNYCKPDQIAKAAKLAKQGHGAFIDTGRHVLRSMCWPAHFMCLCLDVQTTQDLKIWTKTGSWKPQYHHMRRMLTCMKLLSSIRS